MVFEYRVISPTVPSQIQAIIREAQLIQHHKGLDNRFQRSLEVLQKAEKALNDLLQDINAELADHEAKCDELKKQANNNKEGNDKMVIDVPISASNGKGKAKERGPSVSADSITESTVDVLDNADGDLPNTPAGEAFRLRRLALHGPLRDCRVTLHQIKFLQGDVYHTLGPRHSADEDECYAMAEEIRRGILKRKTCSIEL